jgi:arginyl-tRNA synthetase
MSAVDPAIALLPLFRTALETAFGPDLAGEDPVLRPSAHADVQANLAMALAKRLGKPPRVVAEAIAAALPKDGPIARVEIAGPGFLNLTLTDAFVEGAATAMLNDPRLGVPEAAVKERVVIDYSAPNVAKEMHVGHLRSTIIGDSLARLLSFVGHEVIRHNHVGDWGTPFGMLIEHLLDLGENEAAATLGMGELSSFYKAARKKFDEDQAFAERARHRVVELQRGDAETLRLWKLLVELSKSYFQTVYDKLDVTLRPEDVRGESFYNPRLAPLTDELLASGAARVDQGAVCVFVPGFVSKEKEPLPLIVRKSDGGYGYAATDLAAIRHRARDLGATRLLYVVGAPQEQHLAMVFGAAKELGFLGDARAEHVSFGSVLGTDKKMFKTRQGETVRLVDLIDAAIEKADAAVRERFADLDDETARSVAHDAGIGAVKFADLSSDRVKDYVFDIDRMVRFEGKTGGYVQYAHARTRSIFRKAEGAAMAPSITLADDAGRAAERALLFTLLGFPAAVRVVERALTPHVLCTYLYDVAEAFSSFYEHCDVLKAAPETRASRLAMCELTSRVLSLGLSLLGIHAPQRM